MITKDGGALACVHMDWVSLAMCADLNSLHNTTASQSTKPFCTLTLGKITRQTQIVEKTASPTWNEVYNLYLPTRACARIDWL